MSGASWTATESRVVAPYARYDEGLREVRMRIAGDADYAPAGRFWLTPEERDEGVAPSLAFDVDAERIGGRVGIPPGDLRLHVSVRDRALKRWEVVESWPLLEVPATYDLALAPDAWAVGRRTEIAILVAPSHPLPAMDGRASRVDQVVASTSFEIAVRVDGTRFNVATAEPTWFAEAGLPEDTVWAIDWDTREPTTEPIAAFTVVMNEARASALQNAFGDAPGAGALATQLAVDVFVEVATSTLQTAGDFDPEPGTLMGAVAGALGIETADDFERLRARLQHDVERIGVATLLRARAQSRLGLGKALEGRRNGGT